MLALGHAAAHAQEPERVRLSGYVRSAVDDEVLRSARLEVLDEGLVIGTNRFGFYALQLPRGTYRVAVSNIGYATVTRTVALESSTSIDFALPLRPVEVTELTVTAAREPPDVDPGSVEMSVIRLDVAALSTIPVVLGEADPVRALTLYPGITTANDATSGADSAAAAAASARTRSASSKRPRARAQRPRPSFARTASRGVCADTCS